MRISRGKPLGLAWRCHYWYVTAVIGIGILTDILVYSILIPVLPFQLEKLGYDQVAALNGYLLFAYSGGLAIATPPVAWYSERYSSRRAPLNLGLLLLIGCQFMLMFAPAYWLMVLARVLQGVSGSMLWISGFALVSDMTPPEHIGRQLGFVMTGFSLGLLLGPTVGGALYDKFGWNAPHIFIIICLVMDLVGRALVIDRDEALRHGIDPKIIRQPAIAASEEKADREGIIPEQKPTESSAGQGNNESDTVPQPAKRSLLWVVIQMGKSTRALAPLVCALIFGLNMVMIEATLPLHLKDIWGFNPTKVGLVLLAGAIPPLLGSPLVGWLSDKWGTEWVIPMSLLLSIPWLCVLIIEKSIALFIVSLALEQFFATSVAAALMAELTKASDKIDGVGYAHVYGGFNLIYGVGSAIGPIIGGQIYDHSTKGWIIICIIAAATDFATVILTGCFSGDVPLLTRFKAKF